MLPPWILYFLGLIFRWMVFQINFSFLDNLTFTEKSIIHILQPSFPYGEHFTCFDTFIVINGQWLILV